MAITVNVHETKAGEGSIRESGRGSQQAAQSQYTRNFNIQVTGDSGSYDGTKTAPAVVLHDDKLPKVNLDPYFYQDDDGNWQIVPWALCSNKSVSRNTQNNTLWTARAEYSTVTNLADEVMLEPVPVGTAESYGKLVGMVTGEDEKVLWQDKSEPKQTTRLPTGNFFDQPFKERIGTSQYQITQFQTKGDINNQSDAEIFAEQARFKVNSETWIIPARARPGVQAGYAMIVDVRHRGVRLPNASGVLPALASDWLFTYVVSVSERDGGWRDKRALIDNEYLTEANDTSSRVLNTSKGARSVVPAFLNDDGTKKGDVDPNTEPSFRTYKAQPEVDFGLIF